ncbi:MAG: TonB-dependent receptor [Caulobacterales bacterium]
MSCTQHSFALTAAAVSLFAAPSPALGQNPDLVGVAERDAIIVTARQRPEAVQAVPGSIAVLSDEEIAERDLNNPQAIATRVPSLNYSSANPRNTALTIRGLGSSVVAVAQSNDGLEGGVGFYMDQVYVARPAAAAFDFVDLARVEVLRGPQGTLFGKNTTAGAVHLISAAPTNRNEGRVELSVGDDGYLQGRVMANAVLAEGLLAARVSGHVTRRDGSLREVVSGARLNEQHTDAARVQLLFTPKPDFQLRLIGDWSNFDAVCCTQVYVRTGATQRPASRQFEALAKGLGYTPPSRNPFDRLSDIDAPLLVKTDQGGVTAIADWDLGGATLTSVSGWRYWNWTAANDRDFTGVRVQSVQRIPSRQDQVSQELRLASDDGGAFDYVAGLYAFGQELTGQPETVYGPDATYWLLGTSAALPPTLLDGYGSIGHTSFRSSSYAVFAESTWRAHERLRLTAGLRYTWEHKDGTYATSVFGGLQNPTPAQRAAQLSVLRPQTYRARDNDESLSGRANIAFDVNDPVMVYASLARGFKSGGINMAGLPLNAANQPALPTAVIRPERNTTVELGVKSELFARRLQVNLAAYATDVADFQANVVDTGPGALRGYLANIPQVTVRGAEMDAEWRLTDTLTVRGSAAYTRARYASYANGPCPLERISGGTQVCDLSGRPLPNTPERALSLGLEYRAPLTIAGVSGETTVLIDTQARTETTGDGPASRALVINGYGVTHASVGFRSNAGWRARLFARNLFDTEYLQTVTAQAGNSGLVVGLPGEPRLVGVAIEAVF